MSGSADDSAEKSHEPTRKKLDDARRKGEVPKSNDLTTAATYAGMLATMLVFGTGALAAGGAALAQLLARADDLSALWFRAGAQPLALGLAEEMAGPLALWLGLPAAAALLALIAQRAIVVAPDRLQPKLSRISVLANAKNKFGRGGLFEFAKSATKLTVFSTILGIYLWRQMPQIVATAQLEPAGVLTVLGRLTTGFLALVLAVAACIGTVDFLWQHQEHIRKNRMSRKELTDEAKQSEGDPHMKSQRRQRATEIAMNSMLADVPKADVVVVNPTHYAVALTWSRAPGSAPVCVAKGTDAIATRIREIAAENGVPVHRDPPTARAIHASVEIGQQILPAQYHAVAAAIRFAETMRAKARRRFR